MIRTLGLVTLLCLVAAVARAQEGGSPDNEPALVIERVSVIPMTYERVVADRTVVIRGETIAAVTSAKDAKIPAGARRVNGRGLFLLPGLADMHMHLSVGDLDPTDPGFRAASHERAGEFLRMFLAAGVTTVRNMAGTPLHVDVRRQVEAGAVLGPRMYLASPIFETRFTLPDMGSAGRLVASTAAAREAVEESKAAGYDFIKVYNQIDAPIYEAILDAARAQSMPVVGHVPFAVGLEGALAGGQRSIEHLRSYDFALDTRPAEGRPFRRYVGWLHTTEERMREVAHRTAAAHTWNCPTLVVARALRTDEQLKSYRPGPEAQRAPNWLQPQLEALVILNAFTNEDRRITQAALPRHLRMLELLQEAGAPLLTGTDTPAAGIVPGYSLHDELEMFVQAGLTPFEALQAATVEPARFLDREARSGTVEVGKSADLVLLRANPLVDIENIRSLAGVVLRGRWHPIAELEGDGG